MIPVLGSFRVVLEHLAIDDLSKIREVPSFGLWLPGDSVLDRHGFLLLGPPRRYLDRRRLCFWTHLSGKPSDHELEVLVIAWLPFAWASWRFGI